MSPVNEPFCTKGKIVVMNILMSLLTFFHFFHVLFFFVHHVFELMQVISAANCMKFIDCNLAGVFVPLSHWSEVEEKKERETQLL